MDTGSSLWKCTDDVGHVLVNPALTDQHLMDANFTNIRSTTKIRGSPQLISIKSARQLLYIIIGSCGQCPKTCFSTGSEWLPFDSIWTSKQLAALSGNLAATSNFLRHRGRVPNPLSQPLLYNRLELLAIYPSVTKHDYHARLRAYKIPSSLGNWQIQHL